MSIQLVSAFIMINGEYDESIFSVEVKEGAVEVLNATGEFKSFNETKKALGEAIKVIRLLERFENEKL